MWAEVWGRLFAVVQTSEDRMQWQCRTCIIIMTRRLSMSPRHSKRLSPIYKCNATFKVTAERSPWQKPPCESRHLTKILMPTFSQKIRRRQARTVSTGENWCLAQRLFTQKWFIEENKQKTLFSFKFEQWWGTSSQKSANANWMIYYWI